MDLARIAADEAAGCFPQPHSTPHLLTHDSSLPPALPAADDNVLEEKNHVDAACERSQWQSR